MNVNNRKIIGIVITIISLCLLVPGLILPIISVKIGAELPIVGELNLHKSTQSVIDTIRNLYQNNNILVAFLILLFSIIVPITKALLVFIAVLRKDTSKGSRIQNTLAIIGKWSMADVFVVATLIAHLSSSSDDAISSKLHIGFYYFLGYCILSIVGFQVLKEPADKTT